MADDGIKISELPSLVAALQAGDYTPVVSGGVTYKFSTFNSFVKKFGNETIAGIKTFSASPIVPVATTSGQATNKGQLDTVDAKATPLSDLSRVFHITGSGIPQFPDNVAGMTSYITAQTPFELGFFSINAPSEKSIVNGRWRATRKESVGVIDSYKPVDSSWSGKIWRIEIYCSAAMDINLWDDSIGSMQIISSKSCIAGRNIIDAYIRSGTTTIWIIAASVNIDDYFEINACYVGSGAYDTPVYDKACCNHFTNYGVLPVPGQRGAAMSFGGSGDTYIVSDNPVIGVTGTLKMKIKTPEAFSAGYWFGNSTATSGIRLYSNSSGTTVFEIRATSGTGTTYAVGNLATNTDYTLHFIFSTTNLCVYVNGVLVYTHTLSSAVVQASANLYIGRDAASVAGINYTLYGIGYNKNQETQSDVTRYHNGDDPVDCQQKSSVGTPHALAVCDDDGELTIRAKIATKLGTANVGSEAVPAYLNAGVPTPCTSLSLNTSGSSASCTGNSASATNTAGGIVAGTNIRVPTAVPSVLVNGDIWLV